MLRLVALAKMSPRLIFCSLCFFCPEPCTFFHVRSLMARLGFLFNPLIEHGRAPFQHVWVQFLCFLTPILEREKNRHFAANRGIKPGLRHSMPVCYPLHHCLSGSLKVVSSMIIYLPFSVSNCLRISIGMQKLKLVG